MNVQLTEEIIRSRASDQSYQKGSEYYRSGAIYSPTWQSATAGIVLTPRCEGSNAPSHHLRVELDAANCITENVTLRSIVASGKMLLTDRQTCLLEEQHDEPEKQARIDRGCTATVLESQ